MKKCAILLGMLFWLAGTFVHGVEPKAAPAEKKPAATQNETKAPAKKSVKKKAKKAPPPPVKLNIIPVPDSEKEDTESGETGVSDSIASAEKLYSAVLLGDESGEVYYSENSNVKWPLASLTKMMSLLVVYDALKAGEISLSDVVATPKAAVGVDGSGIPMKEGENFTVDDLIKAAGIYSANNAIYALADYVGGGVDAFVVKMNAKAKELGLEAELEFHTPAGLPKHITKKEMDMGTAYGIYKLSLEFIKKQKLIEVAGTKKESIHNGKILLTNRNRLIGESGIYGIKTGYHSKSGYNIAVVTERNGLKIITVVFGGKSFRERDAVALAYLDSFDSHFAVKQILDKSTSLVQIPVIHGAEEFVELYPDRNFGKVVNVNDNVNIKIKRSAKVVAPVEKDEILGSYAIYIQNRKILEGNLKARDDVKLKLAF